MPSLAKTYKIATISPDGLSWMKKMRAGAKEIKEKTEGRVKIKIYPGGVQGNDNTVLRKMRIGQLHGGALAASSFTRFYPDLQIYNLPLQFRTREEIDFVRSQMDQGIIDGLAKNGMVSFSLTENGFAYILSKKPIRGAEELKGVKVWVPSGDPVSAKLIQAFGVSPIPLPITDVLAGLQTGLIDALIVPPIVALALQWHNHIDYVTNLPIVYIYTMLAMDKKAFETMSEGDQSIVRTIMNRVFEEVDQENRLDNQKAYQALINQGIKEVQPDLDKMENWQKQAERSIEALVGSGEISQNSLDLLRSHLDTVRTKRAE
ncbi:MAG: TRAP transporter substrate-binding protein DctP [Pseudomonadales bacterium]|nr:TRAP transporter substrate-binding protein DctP [Pseudomonadales bacterium]